MKNAVVIPARNEEKYIEKTLSSITKQTVPPDQIIVVDDGSSDRTGEIASRYSDVVIRLPDRGYSVVSTPVLASVINHGLRKVDRDVDYVSICSADNVLPEDFFEVILDRMEANPRLVVASGRAKGGPYSRHDPRGTRVVDANFWRGVNGLVYPEVPGWETWLHYKAMQLGYEVRAFRDVVTQPQRSPMAKFVSISRAKSRGEAMYALGYDWKYAVGRCVINSFRHPKTGLGMFLGWLLHRGVRRLDVADWVDRRQKELFWKKLQEIIRRGGRK